MSLIDRLRAVQNSGQDFDGLQEAIEALERFAGSVRTWSEAYPATVFHKPLKEEWAKAHEVLKAAGLNGMDAFSADSMRHVITRVRKEMEEALSNSAEAIKDGREIPTASEPDYWPSAKVIVHQDEVRFGVHRVTATLYAPGLPPGEYDMFLPLSEPALRVDALRYRFLRDDIDRAIDVWDEATQYVQGWTGEILDRAIDAALTPRGAPEERESHPAQAAERGKLE